MNFLNVNNALKILYMTMYTSRLWPICSSALPERPGSADAEDLTLRPERVYMVMVALWLLVGPR